MFSYFALCLVLFCPFEMMTPRHAQTGETMIIVGTRSEAVHMPGVLNPVPTNILTSVPTTGMCTHMGLDTTWKLRVSVGELHEWKQRSAADGKLLSAWIRELCNAEIEDHRVPPVREDREVRAPKGRESSADGVPERTTIDARSSPVVQAVGCTSCGHARHKHGGFKTACQTEGCFCGTFREVPNA